MSLVRYPVPQSPPSQRSPSRIIETLAPAAAPPQTLRPRADIVTTGWSSTPLWSKINDQSDATVITSTI